MPDPTSQEPTFKCPFCGHTATFGRLGGDKFSCGACGLWSNPDGTPHPYPAPAEPVEELGWLCGMCGGTTPHGYPDCLHHKAAPTEGVLREALRPFAAAAEALAGSINYPDGYQQVIVDRGGTDLVVISGADFDRARAALATPPVDAGQPTAWAVFFNNPGAKPIVETSRLKAEKAFRELGESADRMEPLYTAPAPDRKAVREAYQRAGDIASNVAKGYAKQAEESKHKDGPLYTEQCRRGRTSLDIAERIYRLRDAALTSPDCSPSKDN